MRQLTKAAGILLITASVVCGQSASPKPAKPPKAPPPPRAAVRPRPPLTSAAPKNEEAAKGRGAQRLANPGNPVERLMAMPPEKREQILEKLPPRQQANLRDRLDRFDKLPAEQRARMNQMWSAFNSLPPEKQAIVTRQLQAFNSLPDARREDLKPVLQRLRVMPEARRNALLSSEAFKSRYSPEELQMLSDISQNYPLPPR